MPQLVPFPVFQNRTSPIPLSELDTDLEYISNKTLSVKDAAYGAIGDGVTDDTVAIQAAITAAQAANCELFFPAGNYRITASLSITNRVRLRGAGRAASLITWVNNTLTAVTVATSNYVEFIGLGFLCQAAAPTNGGAISLTGSGGAENTFSVIRDCQFSGGFNQIDTIQAYAWVIDSCRFTGAVNFGVRVRNTLNPDFGDSTITNCVFYVMGANCTLIEQASSGGLRLIGNKFLSGLYGYRMALDIGVVTTDLLIVGNSFENQTGANLRFNTGGGGAAFSHVLISGNQFGYTPTAIDMTDASAFLDHINISNNLILLPAAGAVVGISITNSTIFEINGNVIDSQAGTPIGISIGAACTAGKLGINHFGPGMGQHHSVASSNVILSPGELLGQTGVAVTAPADLVENILATFKLPPRSMGLNGKIVVESEIAVTNNANVKTLNVRLGGIGGAVLGTFNAAGVNFVLIRLRSTNRGANNSQLSILEITTNGAAVVPTVLVTAQDTTAARDIVITATKTIAGDNIILNDASCMLWRN